MNHRPSIDPGDAIAVRLLHDAKQVMVTDSNAPTAWLRFLRHCQRTDRFFTPAANLAWHQYVVDKILPKDVHRKNAEYAGIWIGLAQAYSVSDKQEARTTFKYMKLERIGLDVSAFYQAWSDLELAMGNVTKSNAIIAQGRRRLAGQDTQQLTETVLLPPATPMPSSTTSTSSPSGDDLLSVSTCELIRPQNPATPIVSTATPIVPSTEPTPTVSQMTTPSSLSTINNTAPIEAIRSSRPPLATKKYDWSQLSPSPEKKVPIQSSSTALKKKIRFEERSLTKKQEKHPEKPVIKDSKSPPLRKENMSPPLGKENGSLPLGKEIKSPSLGKEDKSPHVQQAPISNIPKKASSSEYQSVIINGLSYLVLDRVGRGGSGEVFKVVASSNQQNYALKKVKLSNNGQENLDAIRNEISLLQKLRGKANIIELIDSQEVLSNKTIWMVFEFGEIDLAKILKSQNSQGLQVNYIRTYWQQMLEAVQTIHSERVVHSDLKPANFMIVKGVLKLIDFGIASAIQSDETTHIVRHSQVGTINYMSPEAIAGPADPQTGTYKLGRASDIWSLGCILYQMVFGKPPFHELSFVQKIHAITDDKHNIDFGLPARVASELLPEAIDVMRRCLSRDSSKRPTIPQLLQHPFLTTIPRMPTLSRDQLHSLVVQLKTLRLPESDPAAVTRIADEIYTQLKRGSNIDLTTIVRSQARSPS